MTATYFTTKIYHCEGFFYREEREEAQLRCGKKREEAQLRCGKKREEARQSAIKKKGKEGYLNPSSLFFAAKLALLRVSSRKLKLALLRALRGKKIIQDGGIFVVKKVCTFIVVK